MTLRTKLPADPPFRRKCHLGRRSAQLLLLSAMLLVFSALGSNGEAASLEVRAGGGDIDTLSTARYNAYVQGSYERVDGLLLFNEGAISDLFIGAEYDSSFGARQHFNRLPSSANPEANYQNAPYSLRIIAASIGMRSKPFVGETWYLYLAPGLIAGRAEYSADLSAQPLVLLSSNEGVSRFIRGRVGLGAVVGFTEQLALGIEATFTQSSPEFTIWVRNKTSGLVESRRINNRADMFGIVIGLHYNL
jgi:hypothetical protein